MITIDPLGPKFEVGQQVRTWDDNDHRKGYASGEVIGTGSEGIIVKWDDLEDETYYDFDKIDILENDLIIEHGCPRPPSP